MCDQHKHKQAVRAEQLKSKRRVQKGKMGPFKLLPSDRPISHWYICEHVYLFVFSVLYFATVLENINMKSDKKTKEKNPPYVQYFYVLLSPGGFRVYFRYLNCQLSYAVDETFHSYYYSLLFTAVAFKDTSQKACGCVASKIFRLGINLDFSLKYIFFK